MKTLQFAIILFYVFTIFEVAFTQSIGTFSSVQPTAQVQNLVLPSTHTFQFLTKSGTLLSDGTSLGINLDFTGFVPNAGSSELGKLSISSEVTPAKCAIFDVQYNPATKLWEINSGKNVSFKSSDLGQVATFCSGTVTPNNTIMVCEENITSGDNNSDGFQDLGWVIEIDPLTGTVIDHNSDGKQDKLWALGRHAHENVVIKSDQSVLYWGADHSTAGYVYKFVPTTPGDFSEGSLFVLKTTASFGTGDWLLVSNTSQGECNTVLQSSTALTAYNFNGVEDVDLGLDGKVYFAAKGPGRVYRFTDNGTTVSGLEIFVENTSYDVDGAGPFPPEAWGLGNDNLAFDNEGNLWVLQDGGRNHIWVVGAGHTAAAPDVRLFATTPLGSEPTGITFSPDYRFLFMSFQHPSTSNTTSQVDAANSSIVFNTHTTVVIARKEELGTTIFPLANLDFNLTEKSDHVLVSCVLKGNQIKGNLIIERSVDGINFEKINESSVDLFSVSESYYKFEDNNISNGKIYYYRLEFRPNIGAVRFSRLKSISVSNAKMHNNIFPTIANNYIHITNPMLRQDGMIEIYNYFGKSSILYPHGASWGSTQTLKIDICHLGTGVYLFKFNDGTFGKFIKIN